MVVTLPGWKPCASSLDFARKAARRKSRAETCDQAAGTLNRQGKRMAIDAGRPLDQRRRDRYANAFRRIPEINRGRRRRLSRRVREERSGPTDPPRAHSVQAVHGKPIVDGDKKLDRASARGSSKQRRDNARNTLLLAERNGFGCRGHAAALL